MLGGDFLALRMEAGGALVINLQTITANVALAGFGVAGDDAGQGDESACVLRPTLQDGKVIEREIVFADYFFAGAGGNCLGEKLPHLGQLRKHFYFVQKSLGGFNVHEGADAGGDLVERVHF